VLVLETLAHVCFVRSRWNLKAVSVQMHSAVVVFTSFAICYMNVRALRQCFAKAGSTINAVEGLAVPRLEVVVWPSSHLSCFVLARCHDYLS